MTKPSSANAPGLGLSARGPLWTIVMASWRSARLLSIFPLSRTVSGVRIQGPRELVWGPGQHLAMRELSEEAPVSYYSIASAPLPTQPGVFELAVGPDSKRFFERADDDRDLLLSGPAGGLDESRLRAVRHLVLIGMGTGIAPLRSTLHWTRQQGLSLRRTLLAGYRSREDCLFAEEFDRQDELDFRPVLSRPDAGWPGRVGHVQNHLESLPVEEALYYVCGSRPMTESVAQLLVRRGVVEQDLVCEGY